MRCGELLEVEGTAAEGLEVGFLKLEEGALVPDDGITKSVFEVSAAEM